jgi:hypothetical protein
VAEQETEKAYQEIDNLKRNYDQEILALNQRLSESSQSQYSQKSLLSLLGMTLLVAPAASNGRRSSTPCNKADHLRSPRART